jgi:hypothetical protein
MTVLQNKWVEKIKKKRAQDTAPAYDIDNHDTWQPIKADKIIKRFSHAARTMYTRTLRGVRK